MAERASLDGLPDELVLEILQQHLNIVRSYETQSTDFKDKRKEKTRQSENRVFQRSLRSVCLTSRRMNQIATPILNASFIGSATRHGLKPLRLFYERISSSCVSGGNSIDQLQYVEVRLSDDLGHSLHTDTFAPDATHLVAQYFHLLADIVNSASNLQHLSVTILETSDVSFWKYVTAGENTTAALTPMTAPGQGFEKLQTLCLQMHISSSLDRASASFDRICSVMSRAPLLSDFRAHGGVTCALPAQLSELGTFGMLKRIEITECMLEIELVAQILSACEELRHVVCTWAFLDDGTKTLSDLYTSLLQHTETLESLHLDTREVRSACDLDESQCFGSLRPFKCLETLIISENCFLGPSIPYYDWISRNWQRGSPLPPMAELLPPCLTSFEMAISWNPEQTWYVSPDRSPDLWDWVADYNSSGLNLVYFSVEGEFYPNEAPNLTKAFLEMGVQFEVKKMGYRMTFDA